MYRSRQRRSGVLRGMYAERGSLWMSLSVTCKGKGSYVLINEGYGIVGSCLLTGYIQLRKGRLS